MAHLGPPEDLVALALQLMHIPSLSGEETEALLFLERWASRHGLFFSRIDVSDNRWNLLIYQGKPLRAILTTHVDVVPGGPAEPTVRDGRLIGRGACDAKGILAAMMLALLDVIADGISDVGLLVIVGEETLSDGAKQAATALEPVSLFINGEPTEMKFVRAQKGVLSGRITVTGKACHSGYPHLGHSAIEELLDVLQSLRKSSWPVHETRGETTCNIGLMAGGTGANVVPSAASADILIRVSSTVAEAEQLVLQALTSHAQWTKLSFAEPSELTVPSWGEHSVVSFGSDVPYLKKLGSAFMFGPGSISVAHTDGEWVSCSELEEARSIYRQIVSRSEFTS